MVCQPLGTERWGAVKLSLASLLSQQVPARVGCEGSLHYCFTALVLVSASHTYEQSYIYMELNPIRLTTIGTTVKYNKLLISNYSLIKVLLSSGTNGLLCHLTGYCTIDVGQENFNHTTQKGCT